ncbi:tyrosine-type recombinase/integrase [Cupriavidus sp. H18C2]|uniref:tyrosine-type recombinase/integrase n=1 Tax=Cupriavidus sp. H18C2 TaxID=3241602 RepID=UPI003BF8E7F7
MTTKTRNRFDGFSILKSRAVRRQQVVEARQRYPLESAFSYYAKTKSETSVVNTGTLIRVLGHAQRCFGKSRCITEIMPKDVRTYINAALDRGLKTGTVHREVSVLCAATERYIRDHDLPIRNPFYRAPVPRVGHDAKRYEPVPPQQLIELMRLCYAKDDDIRWMLAIMMDTGARTAEVCGAALADFRVDHDPPHFVVEEKPWRRVKTRASKRKIPLAGIALWAAKRIVETAAPGQIFAFPRYVEKNGHMRSCSSAFKSWLLARNFVGGPHWFRHTFVDRLRTVDCPVDMRRALLGWSPRSAEGRYGVGPSLASLAKWVQTITSNDFQYAVPFGTQRRLSTPLNTYNNTVQVLRALTALGKATVIELEAATRLDRYELDRCLRYGRDHGAIDLEAPVGFETRRRHRYSVTGKSIPPIQHPRRIVERPAHTPAFTPEHQWTAICRTSANIDSFDGRLGLVRSAKRTRLRVKV